ncbi:MAG: AAA family ATPase [Anaerolineae bacterium]|nr:AAA family ATPase [Anaerolineae bacterium]
MEARSGIGTRAAAPAAPIESFIPEPRTIDETSLGLGFLSDLTLKLIYYKSDMSAMEISSALALPFVGVLDKVLEFLKREELVEITGSKGFGERGYQYSIAGKGSERALQALDRDQYIGPAPVSLELYNKMVLRQSIGDLKVGPDDVQRALSHLILSAETINKLGPAINSGRSMFLYGPPGNGKTVIAKSIIRMLKGNVYIPYTIIVDGQIIRVFDELNHRRVEESPAASQRTGGGQSRTDPRWVKIRRPEILVGGELGMANLDLIFDPIAKTYEAPFQMKANNGLFVIDDFGRQALRPQDLLNRWIVPLELRVDFLALQTGKKIEVPFDELIVFSTNLDPRDLVDDAFLRRIRHKIKIDFPDEKIFFQIMQRECAAHNIDLPPEAFVYLMQRHYFSQNRPLRACHPRDILDQIQDIASYLGTRPTLSKQLLDAAVDSYFADI